MSLRLPRGRPRASGVRFWWCGLAAAALFITPVGPASSAGAATPLGTPVPVAGVAAFGIGAGQLGSPGSLALDSRGDVFVVDQPKNRVQEYVFNPGSSSYAKVGTTVAGVGGLGSASTQLDLQGSSSYAPSGVALDPKGDLFVADSGNDRVLEYVFNAATSTYASMGVTVAGVGGLGSGSTQLNSPSGVALDPKGDLFVADSGNDRVLEYVFNAATSTYASMGVTVAGVGGLGSGSTQLNSPSGVALDPKGDLFVADSLNFRVSEYTANSATGGFAATATVVASQFTQFPEDVAFDASGDLFVSHSYLGYGGVSEFVYSPTTSTYASTGTSVDTAAMIGPSGIGFDTNGDLFVGETSETSNPSNSVWDAVMEFSYTVASDTFTPVGTVMGQVGRNNYGITALALDPQGDLFVADTIANTGVNEFAVNPSTGAYSTAGRLIGAASSGLAVDSAGDVFIASPGNVPGVLEYPRNPTTGGYPPTGIEVPGASQLSSIVVGALALDRKNDLFAADGTQVLEFVYSPTSDTYAAAGTVVAGVGGAGSGASQLAGVGGLAMDANGDLFVSDPPNARVQEYLVNPSTGTYGTNGMTVAGSGGKGTGLNQLAAPTAPLGSSVGGVGGIAVDESGDLFAYDTGNARVMEYTGTPSAGTYAANGSVVYSESQDNWPEQGGVAVDARGDLFLDSNLSSAVVDELSAATTTAPPLPVVTGITPSTGPAAGGTAVTVSGSNLGGGGVTFGTTAATAVSCSASACTATSPAGSGAVNVTVTTTGGTSVTNAGDQFTYQTTAPALANLLPDPGFETSGTPADSWGGKLARSEAVVHSGLWALAQTTSSTSGGWDLDTNPAWYAPITSTKSYTASIWVRASGAVRVDLSLDLLSASGTYVDSASGPTVSLAANVWTQLTITGIVPSSKEVNAGMEPNFSKATKGTIIYWDDMSVTSN